MLAYTTESFPRLHYPLQDQSARTLRHTYASNASVPPTTEPTDKHSSPPLTDLLLLCCRCDMYARPGDLFFFFPSFWTGYIVCGYTYQRRQRIPGPIFGGTRHEKRLVHGVARGCPRGSGRDVPGQRRVRLRRHPPRHRGELPAVPRGHPGSLRGVPVEAQASELRHTDQVKGLGGLGVVFITYIYRAAPEACRPSITSVATGRMLDLCLTWPCFVPPPWLSSLMLLGVFYSRRILLKLSGAHHGVQDVPRGQERGDICGEKTVRGRAREASLRHGERQRDAGTGASPTVSSVARKRIAIFAPIPTASSDPMPPPTKVPGFPKVCFKA